MTIWNQEIETMPVAAMRQLQLGRLQELVDRVYRNAPFYRYKMEAVGVMPADIRSLADITKLPLMTKQDMRDNYPYGLLAVPLKQIVRFHSSSGTTGRPTAVAYTKNDVDMWAESLARTLVAGGLEPDSVFQVAVNYGMFTGGLGMHYAAEKAGAAIVPASSGNPVRQAMLMQDFGVTAIIITPSYALHLAEALQARGIDPRSLALKSIFCGAEAWSDSMRLEIEKVFGTNTYDVYGLSEIIGPGVATDCRLQAGLHLHEDLFYPEIIDPVTAEPLPDGQVGELVITTLTKEGMPMLRYRTRDLTALGRTPCACGRTGVTMQRVTGRSDDMLIIRGVNVFPSQIESVLLEMGATAPHYQLIIERKNNLDELTVLVEPTEAGYAELGDEGLRNLEKTIQNQLKAVLNIKSIVRLVLPHTIERSEGKAKRVVDNRK
ncbi:phenylacetate--CoA ligase family protein [Sporomusa termitida]|uniref:Phenylacetate-coenzyme A ligase n=1 Tax=Sporomusa termitida TaxID=2377 RepID=A0A517E0P6_9FIRM|nr:phenylacetate--CoA ligase [Sporomusa termitida]QDR83170.1 Phenylacetate-coenzyme A ligase [Sporomusa termitida]